MRKARIRKLLAWVLLLVFIVPSANAQANKDSTVSGSTDEIISKSKEGYAYYNDQSQMNTYLGERIEYLASNVLKNSSETVQLTMDTEIADEVVVMNEESAATFIIDAPIEARYTISFEYFIDNESLLSAEIATQINGEYPFIELKRMVLESRWAMPDEQEFDRYDNETVSLPIKIKSWEEKAIMDSSYRYGKPFEIELKKGSNALTIDVKEGDFLLSKIILNKVEGIADYTPQVVAGDHLIILEAEDMTYRNDSSVRASAEYNVDVTPYRADKRVLNILDGSSFKSSGQKVSYIFNVEEAGYYYLGFNYRQKDKADFPVFADIYINGSIPYGTMKSYPFQYTTKFENSVVGEADDDKAIGIYLSQGEQQIDLVLNMDPVYGAITDLNVIMDEIKALALEIQKLTGSKIDKYRDFDLEDYIPGVEGRLLEWSDRLQVIKESLSEYSPTPKTVGALSSIKLAQENLKRLAEKPNELPSRLSELSSGTTFNTSVVRHISNEITLLDSNKLSIDKLYFFQDEKDVPDKASVLKRVGEAIKRFFYSFFDQSYSIDNTNPEHLQVWVNRPRQYVEILQKMVDESFTPQTGIKVDLSIMPDQNKLILSNAANEAPDVAQSVNYVLPFDLAIRDAIVDLTTFENYDEVVSRFSPGLLIPSSIGEKVYSLPETMNFYVLFYRTDILESLDIPVPNTMEEVTDLLPELQRRGMGFFYPSASMLALRTFAATMPPVYQAGGGFYSEQLNKSAINSDASIKGLTDLTDLFRIYNAPQDVASFYQRFRNGDLPLGISDYTAYTLLANAAPEIADDWEIALYPGFSDESGEVQRWSGGGAENCIIFKDSEMQQEAWKYLDWWTSTETQTQFGHTLVASYGKEFLWNSANLEAFKDMPWKSENKDIILEQAQWIKEAPRVPGSYLLERELSDVYNRVIGDNISIRNAVDRAVRRVDRETTKKLEEFGYIKEGIILEEYPLPTLEREEGE